VLRFKKSSGYSSSLAIPYKCLKSACQFLKNDFAGILAVFDSLAQFW
jgi:hypothetical protein